MIVGNNILFGEPQWYLGTESIENVKSIEILGVVFNNECKGENHVNTRIQKCYRSYYSLRDAGFCYPGTNTDVKTYMWNTICKPVLLYGCESISLSKKDITALESAQGNIIKQSIGLSKCCQSTNILQAMYIKKIKDELVNNTLSLWKRVFAANCTLRRLCSYLYTEYVLYNTIIPGTLLTSVINSGQSPVLCSLQKIKVDSSQVYNNGVVDSLRMVLKSKNYIKYNSPERHIAFLLCKSF
jgi:hypothetical protein